MTLRHIRIFEAVCENGCSMTKAAEVLCMTQPAVSLAVGEMERYYGVKLFDRIGRRLYLTEAGGRFLDYARRLSRTFSDLENTMKSWDGTGRIRVGASVSIGAALMPELSSRYAAEYPSVEVAVRVDRSDRLENALREHTLDFALIEGVVHAQELCFEDFLEDRLAVLSSGEAAVLSAEEFLAHPFLLREHGSGTRELFDSTLRANGLLPPAPLWESLSTAALLNAAEKGLGLAVAPCRMAKERLAAGSLSEVSLRGVTFCRKYKIVYHKDKYLTPSVAAFLALCRRCGEWA